MPFLTQFIKHAITRPLIREGKVDHMSYYTVSRLLKYWYGEFRNKGWVEEGLLQPQHLQIVDYQRVKLILRLLSETPSLL
jgi:hypothetical protein